MGDALGLVLGKLREPAAVGLHDGVVAEPALVDPSIGAEQEAIGMTGEELAPLGHELAAALADAAAVGELAHQLGIYLQQLPHPLRRRRESGMRPDKIVRETPILGRFSGSRSGWGNVWGNNVPGSPNSAPLAS